MKRKREMDRYYEYWYCIYCQKRWRFFKASIKEIHRGQPRCPVCHEELYKTG